MVKAVVFYIFMLFIMAIKDVIEKVTHQQNRELKESSVIVD